jgi:cardiolipin synthase
MLSARAVTLALPTSLTIARLFAVPATVWLIVTQRLELAFWVFLVAGLSDALDGALARLCDARSQIGQLLDPVADKLLLVATFGALATIGLLPVWVALLVAFRDVAIVTGIGAAHRGEVAIDLRPMMIGKLATALQVGLAGWTLAEAGLDLRDDGVTTVLTLGVAASAVASGLAYGRRWLGAMRNGRPS